VDHQSQRFALSAKVRGDFLTDSYINSQDCIPTIIDYGVGNVASLRNILEFVGGDCVVSRDANEIANAKKLLLPGVGAFDHAMKQLQASGLIEAARNRHVPVLGVCLGMQLLGDGSEEGQERGLGLIKGWSRKLQTQGRSDLKVPNNGWRVAHVRHADAILGDAGGIDRYYFNHGYYLDCESANDVLATVEFAGDICCAVNRSNIWGVQFHPEKSHRAGMALMKRFLKLAASP
jgi:imidazole glycerol-phosphate synthase subunit HisH